MPRVNPSPIHGRDNVTANITAKAGGTKAAAVALSNDVNVIATCATLNDSVLAPPARYGASCVIANLGAAACAVYGQGTDTINGVATATAFSLAAGKTMILYGQDDGKWVGGSLA